MSTRPPSDRPRSAEVLNLMCARYEAALADASMDATLRAHGENCARCTEASREFKAVQALIAEATGPTNRLSEDFLDAVLQRANTLDGRLLERESPRPRRIAPAIAASLAAAAVLLAFWAGGAREHQRQLDAHNQVRVHAANVAPEAPPVRTAQVMRPAPPMTPLAARETRTPMPTRIGPTVPAAAPIPEPVVDLGAEIQVMLRERVVASKHCPEHTSAPIWVTATVQPDGSLTNRSVMSAGNASEAHRCVSRALDQLLLPPGSPTTTVTFELSW